MYLFDSLFLKYCLYQLRKRKKIQMLKKTQTTVNLIVKQNNRFQGFTEVKEGLRRTTPQYESSYNSTEGIKTAKI